MHIKEDHTSVEVKVVANFDGPAIPISRFVFQSFNIHITRMGTGGELSRNALRLVLVCCAAFCAADAKPAPVVSEAGAMRYLSRFGYLPSTNVISERIISEETMSKAIAEFQSFMGLNITGNLDAETTHLMSLPRCGVKDKREPNANGRSKRFAFMGSKWFDKKLTYKITKYSRSLYKEVVDREIARAFAVWSEYTDLSFTPGLGQVHIEIRFERGYHGHEDVFDGSNGVLAHAFAPDNYRGSNVHFDDDEHWTAGDSQGTNLFQVAVHEFGHVLGLDHSRVAQAIMYATYQHRWSFGLHIDDIQGIQTLYGPKTNVYSPKVPVPQPRENVPRCKNFQIDFPLNWAEGSLKLVTEWPYDYTLYWKTTPNGMAAGYPRLETTDNPDNISTDFQWYNGRGILKMCTNTFTGSDFDGINGLQNL